METQSQISVEPVFVSEKMSKGACDHGVVVEEPCEELVQVVSVEHVLVSEDVSKGAFDHGVVVDELCKNLVRAVSVEHVLVSEEVSISAFDHGVVGDELCKELVQVVSVEHVLAAEEVSKGALDHGLVGDEPCKDLVEVVEVSKEQGSATKDMILSAANDDLTVENCTQKLHSLPANGDGDGDGNGNGKTPTMDENSSSLASLTEIAPLAEEIIEPSTFTTSSTEMLPEPETNEPSWGDVPDGIPDEPITLPPRPAKRPRVAPECEEVDDVVQTMRNILFNLTYADDAHLNPEDEAKVRDLLEYHPKAEEKTGSGIDYIKIKRHSTYKDVRCFWVVRTDGTETDFSYHKCLKEKVAKDHPSFVGRYDAIYRAPKRPRQG